MTAQFLTIPFSLLRWSGFLHGFQLRQIISGVDWKVSIEALDSVRDSDIFRARRYKQVSR
jgi:hypothetical protein